jgi:hypothetical protein
MGWLARAILTGGVVAREPLTFHIIRRMQMRTFLTIMMVAVSLSTADIVLADEAGSCHFHRKKLPRRKLFLTARLIVKNSCCGRQDYPSWDIIEQEKIELADGKEGNEWLVIFVNPAAAGKAKGKLLFVFYSAREFYSRKLYRQVERQSPCNVSVYLSRLPSPYSLSPMADGRRVWGSGNECLLGHKGGAGPVRVFCRALPLMTNRGQDGKEDGKKAAGFIALAWTRNDRVHTGAA